MVSKNWLCFALCLILISCVASKAAPTIESGPMNGFATANEVGLWVRLTEPGTVRFRYWSTEPPKKEHSTIARSAGRDGRTVSVVLTDLPHGQSFRYAVDVQSGSKWIEHKQSYPLSFQTQVIWQRRSQAPDFTLAFGSCAYISDPKVDAPNKPSYGGEYHIFDTIADKRPDFMLWLGDAVYLRPADWGSAQGILRRYKHVRAFGPLQRLLGQTHHYATWDDHDFGPNDSDWTYVHKAAALDLFKEFWLNPSYGLPKTPGVFGQFSWSDADFFLLDNRYHRTPSRAPDGHDKTQLGEVQFRWLIDALTSSPQRFKVVVGGGQFLSPYDRWEGYAQFAFERDRLLDEIRRRQIEGVFFLSGDRHHTELVRIHPTGLYPLYDFTSSPLTSRGASASGELDSPVRIDGTLVNKKRNFGMLRFMGPPTDRKVEFETFDNQGKSLWKHVIKAQELKFKSP